MILAFWNCSRTEIFDNIFSLKIIIYLFICERVYSANEVKEQQKCIKRKFNFEIKEKRKRRVEWMEFSSQLQIFIISRIILSRLRIFDAKANLRFTLVYALILMVLWATYFVSFCFSSSSLLIFIQYEMAKFCTLNECETELEQPIFSFFTLIRLSTKAKTCRFCFFRYWK